MTSLQSTTTARGPRYRARDALLAPGLVTLVRIPLAVAFPWVAGRKRAALLVLALAGASDILDGWAARRFGMATPTGAALDPVADKLFVGSVVGSLLLRRQLGRPALVALTARELGEIPLVAWRALRGDLTAVRQPRSNILGKLATTLQFASTTMAIVAAGMPRRSKKARLLRGLIVASGVVGVASAISYWSQEIAAARRLSVARRFVASAAFAST
jgi:CDP-diacylglycerol--glycerol-3-phosphate 3-phosphatidyltransferase/cardiolipin synthase